MGALHRFRKRAGAKLRSVRGFSLVELLLTTLILLLVTEIVADGIPSVIRLYRRTVDIANAEAYLSTTMIALRSKLSLASEVTVNGQRVYRDPAKGYYVMKKDETKGIQIQYLSADMEELGTPLPLASTVRTARNETRKLISSYDDEIRFDPEGRNFIIEGLKIKSSTAEEDASPLAELKDDFIIHTVSPQDGRP